MSDWWRWEVDHHRPPTGATIAVIERPSESYDEHHARKTAEAAKRRVPFGFARALINDEDA